VPILIQRELEFEDMLDVVSVHMLQQAFFVNTRIYIIA